MASKRRDYGSWEDWLWKYAIPPLAVFLLVLFVIDFPESVSASKNEGAHGTYTSTRAECGLRGGCSYYGRFVSDDGTVILKDVFIDGGVDQVDVSVEAQYFEDSRNDIVYELNSRDWLWALLLAVGSLLYLAGWGWMVVRPWIRERKS